MTLFRALALLLLLGGPALADDYPTRPITLVVPFAAGGNSDVIARVVSDEMGRILGKRIVIENVGGAGGSTALSRVAHAAPDGYTLVIGNSGTNAAAYTIYPSLTFKPDAFTPIAIVAKSFGVLAIKKALPVATLSAFVDYARQNPGKVTLGHAGVGSSNYLICKSFVHAARVDVILVSYRGAGPALTDLIGGQIDGVCDAASSVSPAILDGKAQGLAVASNTRLPTLPQVPTSAEAGLPEFEVQGWNALFAPAGTPEPIIVKLNAVARQAVASETVRKRFAELSAVAPAENEMSVDYLKSFVPTEIAKFKTLLDAK